MTGNDDTLVVIKTSSKLFRFLERQTAFAIKKFTQAFVTGTAGTTDDFGCDPVADFAAGASALEPVFPTDWAAFRNRRD